MNIRFENKYYSPKLECFVISLSLTGLERKITDYQKQLYGYLKQNRKVHFSSNNQLTVNADVLLKRNNTELLFYFADESGGFEQKIHPDKFSPTEIQQILLFANQKYNDEEEREISL